MLKIQSVNHVSEHLSAIYPVYTETEEGLKQNSLAAVLSGPREIRTVRSPLEGLDLLNYLLSKNSLAAVLSGPREIRTLDLLNAIETRSQLRYGPL